MRRRSSSTCCQWIAVAAHEAIARFDVLADRADERAVRRVVRQVADANAPAPDLVFVRRADAARRRPDLALAAPRFGQQFQFAVVRQDEMRLVAHEEPAGHVDPHRRQFIEFGEERHRIDDHAVADDARHARVKNA